jgi:large subunit ribosomal protein L29
MAIFRVKEIADMSSEDRADKLVDLRVELTRIKTMIKAGGAVEDPTRIRQLRKAIAKILTIEHEMQLGIRKTANQPENKPKKKVEEPPKKAKAEGEPKEITSQ